VLTARHCIRDRAPSAVDFYLRDGTVETIDVSRCEVHPGAHPTADNCDDPWSSPSAINSEVELAILELASHAPVAPRRLGFPAGCPPASGSDDETQEDALLAFFDYPTDGTTRIASVDYRQFNSIGLNGDTWVPGQHSGTGLFEPQFEAPLAGHVVAVISKQTRSTTTSLGSWLTDAITPALQPPGLVSRRRRASRCLRPVPGRPLSFRRDATS